MSTEPINPTTLECANAIGLHLNKEVLLEGLEPSDFEAIALIVERHIAEIRAAEQTAWSRVDQMQIDCLQYHMPKPEFTTDQPTAADDGCCAYYRSDASRIDPGTIRVLPQLHGALVTFVWPSGMWADVERLTGEFMVIPRPDAKEESE